MTKSYERFVALRHLRHTGRSFLSTITIIAILGVFLGVMALASVLSVTGGFEQAFRERVLGVNSHVLVIKFGIDFRDYRDIQEQIERIPGVQATSPFIFHEMIATHGGKSAGVLVKGVEPDTISRVSDLPKYVHQPDALAALVFERFPDDGTFDVPRVLIGKTLAERLNAKEGDTIRITSPLESLDPELWNSTEHRPSSNEFIVAGTYSSGFHEYDNRLVMTDYRALQDFFHQGDVVTGVDVRVEDVFAVAGLARQLRDELPKGRFRVLDWRELNHNLFTSLGLQRIVLAVLFCFIVLVASFNIACTLIMMVLDKQKDIAILKSMGASPRAILWMFVIQGMIIGFIGTINGLIGGLLVCLAIKYYDFGLDPSIYMIDHLPVRLEPLEFAAVGVVAMLICLAATLGPAAWAARLSPVEGLRYE
ncbi:MAG: ABC transporter permease [Myxococcota bacterium]